MMKNIILFILSIFCLASVRGQLRSELNLSRPGDQIIKQQVEYIHTGPNGRDVVWDFSKVNIVNAEYPLIFYRKDANDLTQIIGWEHETQYAYSQEDDHIFLTSYNNKSVEMSFELPELHMRFPLHYGDTLNSQFSGKGRYFRDFEIVSSGKTTIEADASGILIIPGNDTLSNVLRVKRVREYENIGVTGTRMILETYNWYAPGYRYPVFETVKSFVIEGNIKKEDYSTAFYFPLSGLEALIDPDNEAIREESKQDRNILLSCYVAPTLVDSECTLFFELSVNALINIKLCDIMGNTVSLHRHQLQLSAGKHEEKILMIGLRKGYYVVHISANNYTTNQIIMKK